MKKGENGATIYANYGMLGNEKRIIYSADAPGSDIYDEIKVKLPEKFLCYKNLAGEKLLEFPDGDRYLLRDVLQGNKYPYLSYFTDPFHERRFKLEVIPERNRKESVMDTVQKHQKDIVMTSKYADGVKEASDKSKLYSVQNERA